MLVFSRHSWILHAALMICVGLSFVLSNQSYIKLLDSAQHALHRDHAPNPLAGAVQYCEHAHGGHHGHDHCNSEGRAIDVQLTHRHMDSSIVYIVTSVQLVAVPRQSSVVSVEVPQSLDRIYAYRLERPPKPFIARYA